MSLRHSCIALLALALTATSLLGGSVTSSASIWGWDPCPPGQTTSGETYASATASCFDATGGTGTSLVTSQFSSFASNALTLDLQTTTPLGASNIYANGTATWVEQMVVTGGSGSGWLKFDFVNTALTLPSSVIGFNCQSIFNGAVSNLQMQNCYVDSRSVAFTFGQPLEVSFSIQAFAFADGEPMGALSSLVHWSNSLTSVGAYNVQYPNPGDTPIPGAEVHLIPEPAVSQLVMVGGLWLILYRTKASTA